MKRLKLVKVIASSLVIASVLALDPIGVSANTDTTQIGVSANVNKTQTLQLTAAHTNLYKTASFYTPLGASLTPQTVNVLEQNGDWYKIQSWLGPVWLNVNDKTTRLKLEAEHTNLYNTASFDAPTGITVGPQIVVVLEQQGDWYNIESGSSGTAWINVKYPTGSDSSDTSDTSESGSSQQSLGFDEMRLSSDTKSNVKQFYNQPYRVINSINTLSIAGTDYVKAYTKGNILGTLSGYDYCQDDYCFDLNNKFSKFTATIGMDDYYSATGSNNGIDGVKEVKQRTGTMTIIGDGNVLETKDFKYGEEPVNVDVNIEGYSKLIIRIKINAFSSGYFYSYYDILNGQFYYK